MKEPLPGGVNAAGEVFLLNAMGRWRSLRAIVWMQWTAGAACGGVSVFSEMNHCENTQIVCEEIVEIHEMITAWGKNKKLYLQI